MKRHMTISALGALSILLNVDVGQANLAYFDGTGNFYEWVYTGGIGWSPARDHAAGQSYGGVVSGELVTITSAAEQAFIQSSIFSTMGGNNRPYIGAFDAGGSWWMWVTGEPWVYTNWDAPRRAEWKWALCENV